MAYQKLEGLIAAPFTPMFSDGKLDISSIPAYYKLLKSNGVRGAFICGSTGEGVSLTLAEKKEVIEAWGALSRKDPDFFVMPLLGGTSLEECKSIARFASNAGMDGVSFTAPFYFKPASAAVLAEICADVAAAVPELPFYYYHIPVLTGVNIAVFDLLQAIDGRIPNFAGVKYTHEDFMDFLSCLRFQNGRYDMLWGRDENMLAALALGAKGSVGSTFNYAAPLYHALINSFHAGQLETAREWQQKSIDMIRLLGKYGGIATGKAYMRRIGFECGSFRLPVRNMTDADYQRFLMDVEQLGFDSYCSAIPKLVMPEK
jgi:N-acetylneuraminate lyase